MSATNANIEKTKKSVGRPKGGKRKKLEDFDQLDGKARGGDKSGQGEARGAARSLDEFMGYVKPSPYGTRVKEEFVAKLRDMNLSDMQMFAKKVGIYPDYDRANLMQSLIKSFCSYENIKEALVQKIDGRNDVTSLSPEAQQILREGA